MASPPPSSSESNLYLVAIRGVVEGQSVQLDQSEDLLLGRSSKGFQLADPLASLHHAQLSWRIDHWVIRDLGSVSGTFVDGERVTGPRPVEAGNVIRIGDTDLELMHRAPRTRAMIYLGLFAGLVLVGTLLALWMVSRGPGAAATLEWREPIRRGTVAGASSTVVLPPAFLRERGLTRAQLRIRRVTDYDGNGRDEVWLTTLQRDFVITYDWDGEGVVIGDLPAGCMDKGRSLDGLDVERFPALRCPGVVYEYTDNLYRASHQKGVVLWVSSGADPQDPSEGDEEPPVPAPVSALEVVPHRVALRRVERFAGFLAARGIDEPVHYILCDGAVEGADAQLLTANGDQRWLSRGCVHAPEQLGESLGEVLAMAFTETGRQALVDDLTTWYSGSADGLFLTGEQRAVVDAWSAEPGYVLGGTRLEFREAEHFFDPIAPEAPLAPAERSLLSLRRPQMAAPRAVTTTLVDSGVVQIDPPGCHLLEVDVGSWSCALSQGCLLASASFLTVKDVGCGAPVDVFTLDYRGGQVDGSSGPLQVRAVVESIGGTERMDISRARIAYRVMRPIAP